ncbi:MAG TPA: translation initiation factor IF-3 [Bacillota bacterium]|nr:translation initiation factor IF-3 [Bacillota bacterium]
MEFSCGACASALFIFRRYKAISKGSLINEEIRAKEVRLIDPDGQQLGIVSIRDALAKAAEYNMDLVNIAPNAAPPVCRIMDYGKYRYEQQKREKEAKKKQKTMDVKEIRLGIFTEMHDLETKAVTAGKFLQAGDKVRVNMRLRGREMGYVDKGKESMIKFSEMLSELGNIEKNPILEGRNMSMTITPKTEKEKAAMASKLAAEAEAAAAQRKDADE